jgi:hypothetical protein
MVSIFDRPDDYSIIQRDLVTGMGSVQFAGRLDGATSVTLDVTDGNGVPIPGTSVPATVYPSLNLWRASSTFTTSAFYRG